MDNKTLITLSKLTVEARKVIGTINPAKMLKDPAYSTGIFQKIDDCANEELVLLALDLRQQLGLLEGTEPATAEVEQEKYVFGARG